MKSTTYFSIFAPISLTLAFLVFLGTGQPTTLLLCSIAWIVDIPLLVLEWVERIEQKVDKK